MATTIMVPDGHTVQVHPPGHMAGPPMSSGMPPQGMISDPMAAGGKAAMDAALAPAAPANAGGGNSPMGQAKQFGAEMGSETGRPKAKAAAPTAGKPPKSGDPSKNTKKPDGKMAPKSSEKDKAKKP